MRYPQQKMPHSALLQPLVFRFLNVSVWHPGNCVSGDCGERLVSPPRSPFFVPFLASKSHVTVSLILCLFVFLFPEKRPALPWNPLSFRHQQIPSALLLSMPAIPVRILFPEAVSVWTLASGSRLSLLLESDTG